MTLPISLVCLTSSPLPTGRAPTFLGIAGLALVANDAEDVGLATFGVDGVAQGLAVDGPSPSSAATCWAFQRFGVDTGEHLSVTVRLGTA